MILTPRCNFSIQYNCGMTWLGHISKAKHEFWHVDNPIQNNNTNVKSRSPPLWAGYCYWAAFLGGACCGKYTARHKILIACVYLFANKSLSTIRKATLWGLVQTRHKLHVLETLKGSSISARVRERGGGLFSRGLDFALSQRNRNWLLHV